MNNMEKKMKTQQQRLTHDDTIENQKKLEALLREKIDNPILTDEEKDILPEIVAKALLSQGSSGCELYESEQGAIPFGCTHTCLLRMKNMAIAEYITVTCGTAKNVKVDMRELWKQLYERCLELFPKALSEGLLHSKEMPKREESTGYEFNYDKRMK